MFSRPSHHHTKATYFPTLTPLLILSLCTSLTTFLSSIFLLPFFTPSPTTTHPCPHTAPPTTHLLPLLPLTTLIFLLPVPLLQTQHLLLSPLALHTAISGSRALLLDIGIALIGLVLCLGLILLSILVALIYASFTPGGRTAFGGVAIAMFVTVMVGVGMLGVASLWESNVGEGSETVVGAGDGEVKVKQKPGGDKIMGWWKVVHVCVVYFLVFIGFIALLGVAGKQAVSGVKCTGGNGSGLLLNGTGNRGNGSVVPVSVVNGCCGDQGSWRETVTSTETKSIVITVATPVQEGSTGTGSASAKGGVATVVVSQSVTTTVLVTARGVPTLV